MTDTESTKDTATPTDEPVAGTDAAEQTAAASAEADQPTTPSPASDMESSATAPATTPEQDEASARFFSQAFVIPGPPESSPDGQFIVYLQPDANGEQGLWIAATDGSSVRKIDLPFTPVEDRDPVSGRHLRGPQWSPDGTRIALTGMHPDGDRTAVWIVPVEPETAVVAETDDGSASATETGTATGTDTEAGGLETLEAGGPDVEPDDADIETDDERTRGYAVGADDDEHIEIAPVGAEETTSSANGARLLVSHAGADRSPRWSPDGVLIAMTSTIDGRDVIALTTAEGGGEGEIELLTWSRSHDREPAWSRDGKFLAFLRQRPEGEEFHDIYCFSLDSGTLENLTSEKAPAMRHSLEWVPGRNLVAYVTRENDWLSISVVNADNKAGWTVTRESGDKTEPRFAQDEARMVYVRTEGFTTVMCERSLHSSSAVALDPGEGVVRYPRWLNGKRVAYGFSAPQRPFGFLVQENTVKSDRTAIVVGEQPSIGGQQLRQPQPFEFETGPEEMFSGMLYRTPDLEGEATGIVYLPDGPLTTRRGEFQIEEQALASSGATVLTPVIHGASGFGAAVENDLREYADTELESADLAEAGRALGRDGGVDASRLAIVGHGFGGALALVTAGARPGVYGAVVAIDPIIDWSIELANADVAWRTWITDRFGMPLTHADHFALRTPATFSAVIDVPLVLVRTAGASESRRVQLELFTADLDELGVRYEVVDAPDEPLAATLLRVGREIGRILGPATTEAAG